MQEIKSYLAILGLMALAYVGLHYLILLLGLNDVAALILFSLPVIALIAYSTEDTRELMVRSGITIFGCFSSVILAATGLVWFIG